MRQKIVSYKDYVAGWLDMSIHDFLEVLPPTATSAKYALISCLDSNDHPASLRDKSPELAPIADRLRTVGSSLLIETKLLLKSEGRKRIFFGFDEVWFFPSDDITPKPDWVSIVGPSRLTQTRATKIGDWMSENSCSMALGDGEGLNFIVRAHGLVRFILGSSIEQPERSWETADSR